MHLTDMLRWERDGPTQLIAAPPAEIRRQGIRRIRSGSTQSVPKPTQTDPVAGTIDLDILWIFTRNKRNPASNNHRPGKYFISSAFPSSGLRNNYHTKRQHQNILISSAELHF
ncbi:unnamed protein product [Adineta ricciae]|uniref:Uncharacterized protein n=1 Tax=Adineta ricciae TaxID=249248 RepID=A0A814Z5L2_ADIRI|nr:unnamed protein product [Adineta ricciae]